MKRQFTNAKNSLMRFIASSIVLLFLSIVSSAATLLPNGEQTFFKNDGTICSSCSVYMYIPATTTFKNTYQDSAQSILNTNPIITDSAGRAIIYGSGNYRQILKDSVGNTLWDQLTSDVTAAGITEFAGTSGGSANAQSVTAGTFTSTNGQSIAFIAGFTNTTATTLQVSGGSLIPIRKDTAAGPVSLTGNEIFAGNMVNVQYDSGLGVFHLLTNAGVAQLSSASTFVAVPIFTDGLKFISGPPVQPGGRLTLTTLTPVLSSDVTAATTVFYTPYKGNLISLYDGTTWKTTVFAEVSQTLADATKSPSAATVSNLYDMFAWLDGSTFRVTRGPTWASGGGSATARGTGAGSTALAMTNGILMNSVSITNGPSANRGVYVGTISTSASGANGQLNMMFAPAAAANGTNNRLDVWNMYNRVNVSSMSRDSTDTWIYTTATVRASNASNSNRITVVSGLNEDHLNVIARSIVVNGTGGVLRVTGVGLDSTSAISGFPGASEQAGASQVTLLGQYVGLVGLGSHFLQWLEYSEATGTSTWSGDNAAPTLVQSGINLTWKM